LRDDYSRGRRDALSREAVEVARTTNNPRALADALNGRAAAILAPDTLAECLTLGSEILELAAGIGDAERTADGHIQRVHALVQLGDITAAEADLAAAMSLARDLKEPARLWEALGIEAMLALAAGRLTEGEELAAEAVSLGERAQPEMALPVFQLHRYTLCELRGSLEEVEEAIEGLVAEHPARPVFRCALAHLQATVGREPEARRALAELTSDDCSALPFDAEWLYGMSFLAETCGIVGEEEPAALLHRLLLPWAELNVADIGEGVRGSVGRYLGIVSTTMGRLTDAERHLQDAAEMNARMGLLPWLGRTQKDQARMLRIRGGADDRERADELDAAAHTIFSGMGVEPSRATLSTAD
jgi:tetratricopeptide (TPR) repeat protein